MVYLLIERKFLPKLGGLEHQGLKGARYKVSERAVRLHFLLLFNRRKTQWY